MPQQQGLAARLRPLRQAPRARQMSDRNPALNASAAGMAFSALIGMVSIVNVGVAKGDGHGQTHGSGSGSILSLGIRYLTLIFRSIDAKKSPLGLASIVLFAYFATKTIQNLVKTA